MANTNFIDNVTVVVADWLNNVNDVVYDVLGNGTTVPSTKTEVKTNLALNNVDNTADINKPLSTAATAALALKIDETSPTGSAVLPAGTTVDRDGTPSAGFARFNTTLNQFEGYNGTAWGPFGGGATGATGNPVFFENDQIVTGNYTITAAKNAMSAGPITIADGVSVTVPDGGVWTIV